MNRARATPMRGPSREALIIILRRPDVERHLPLTLAHCSPQAIVRKEGSRWVIRELTLDAAAANKAYQEAVSAGNASVIQLYKKMKYPTKSFNHSFTF